MSNHIISFLTWRCGLGCPYCAYHTEDDNLSVLYRPAGKVFKVEREISGQEWLDLLLPFHGDVYDFCGGEPLKHPGFAQITFGLPHWYITSNTLGDVTKLNLKNCRGWTASYHPHVVKEARATFLSHVTYIKSHGVNTSITIVARPDTVDEVIRQCDRFVSEGFHCNIHPYYDEPGFSWDNYPLQWEKLTKVPFTRYDNKLKSWNGGGVQGQNKVCEAGHIYFCIAPDGRIFPCLWGMLSGQVQSISEPSKLVRTCSLHCALPCDFVYGLGEKST